MLSLLLSLTIVTILLTFLNEGKLSPVKSNSEISGILMIKGKYLSCLKLKSEEKRFQCQFPNTIKEDGSSIINNYFKLFKSSSSVLISTIYVLIVAALSLQVYILIAEVFLIGGAKKVNFFTEWAVNAPPMLGVLGTVIAFSIFITQSSDENITVLFKSSFFDAASTTVLGGSVYIINLYLHSLVTALKNNE